jgi:hypothetical protein
MLYSESLDLLTGFDHSAVAQLLKTIVPTITCKQALDYSPIW